MNCKNVLITEGIFLFIITSEMLTTDWHHAEQIVSCKNCNRLLYQITIELFFRRLWFPNESAVWRNTFNYGKSFSSSVLFSVTFSFGFLKCLFLLLFFLSHFFVCLLASSMPLRTSCRSVSRNLSKLKPSEKVKKKLRIDRVPNFTTPKVLDGKNHNAQSFR